LNCLFGIGIFLFAFAGWIASAAWRPAWRIPVFALIAALLFTLHLFAFGLYGLAVASWELGLAATGRSARRDQVATLLLAALQFVPALLLWIAAATMPSWLGGSWGADFRLPAILPFLAIAAVEARPSPRPLAAVAGVLAAALLALRL